MHPPASLLPENFEPEVVGEWMGTYDQFGVFWGNRAADGRENHLYYSPVIHPLADLHSVQEIHDFNWPDGTVSSQFRGLREDAEKKS